MSDRPVLSTQEGSIATLTLNRAGKRNAISREVLTALEEALAGVRDDPLVRVIVLRGAGPMFSSGIDHTLLMEVFTASQEAPFRHLHGDLHRLVDQMVKVEKPIVAVLHGAAVGMGLELALAADFRVAAADCVLGLPEVAFGIIPDVGGTTRLTHLLGPHRAKDLILTGELVPAGDARASGICTRVVAPEALEDTTRALVDRLAEHPPAAVGLGKILVDQVVDVDRATALKLEGVYQSILLQRPDLSDHFGPALAFIQGQLKGARRSA